MYSESISIALSKSLTASLSFCCISLNLAPPLLLYAGGAGKIIAQVLPETAVVKDLRWTSSNESIAINKTNFSLIEGSDSYYYRTYTSLRKTTASKERTIYTCKGQDVINSAEIHGKWVMLNISNRATNKMKLILMDTNGKNRKTLKQWLAGE